jgi:hypothetical protein
MNLQNINLRIDNTSQNLHQQITEQKQKNPKIDNIDIEIDNIDLEKNNIEQLLYPKIVEKVLVDLIINYFDNSKDLKIKRIFLCGRHYSWYS